MRIVAVSRILDEVDIIEPFIRHSATFADHHILLDNGSRDGTVDVLRKLSHEGISLTVYQSPSICFSERDMNNWLYREAIRHHDADWVACLDGDEFYDERQLPDGLRNYLCRIENSGENVVAVRVPWVHYYYTRNDDAADNLVTRRIRHRTQPVKDYKVIASWRLLQEKGVVLEGQHDIQLPPHSRGKTLTEDRLWLAHFSERNTAQHITKFIRGWSKILTAGKHYEEKGYSTHYRRPFEVLRDKPEALLRNEWFLASKNDGLDLICDPMDYRGGPLRYTPPNDPEMQSVKALVGFLSEVASRYGQLIDAVPEAKAYSDRIERQIDRLF